MPVPLLSSSTVSSALVTPAATMGGFAAAGVDGQLVVAHRPVGRGQREERLVQQVGEVDLPPTIVVIFDADDDMTWPAWLLADLPVHLLGRLRARESCCSAGNICAATVGRQR